MTTNQLVALGFPLVTAAAFFVTALFIRKPWAEKPALVADPIDSMKRFAAGEREPPSPQKMELLKQLDETIEVLRKAQSRMESAREPYSTPGR